MTGRHASPLVIHSLHPKPQITMSSPQKQKAKVTEDTNPDPSEEISNSDSGQEEAIQDVAAPSTSQKKKKKKKSKIAKLLGGRKDEVPQELVDRVLDQVKRDHAGAIGSDDLNAESVRQTLDQLKVMDVVRGKAGLGGLNKKDIGEHKAG